MEPLIEWIKLDRLLKRWGLDKFELRQLIDKGLLDEYVDYQKHTGILSPVLIQSLEVERDIFDDERVFKLADVLALEAQDILETMKKPLLNVKAKTPVAGKKSLVTEKHVSRQHQQARGRCRDVASRLLKQNPKLMICEAIDHDEMQKVSKRDNGKYYLENAIRGWIKDLFPDEVRKQGIKRLKK